MSERYVLVVDPDEQRGKELCASLKNEFDVCVRWASNRDHCYNEARKINNEDFARIKLIIVVLLGEPIAEDEHPAEAIPNIQKTAFADNLLVLTKSDRSKQNTDDIQYAQVEEGADLAPVVLARASSIFPDDASPSLVEMSDPADLILQHQLLAFSTIHDPAYAWLGRIIRSFWFDCERVQVSRLTQGFSGALVLAATVFSESGTQEHFVLKLARKKDLWKLRNGVSNWKEIQKARRSRFISSCFQPPRLRRR